MCAAADMDTKMYSENVAKRFAAEERDNNLIFLELVPEFDR